MGREIRRVPPDWKHPQRDKGLWHQGKFNPVFDEDFESACQEWWDEAVTWLSTDFNGLSDFDIEMRQKYKWYWECNGGPPEDDQYYRPAWTEAEATHYQMYETVSEGTPVSPVFASLQELEDWLVNDGYWDEQNGSQASPRGYGHDPASRTNQGWHSEKSSRSAAQQFCKGGWAPSMIVTSHPDGSRTARSNVESLNLKP